MKKQKYRYQTVWLDFWRFGEGTPNEQLEAYINRLAWTGARIVNVSPSHHIGDNKLILDGWDIVAEWELSPDECLENDNKEGIKQL